MNLQIIIEAEQLILWIAVRVLLDFSHLFDFVRQ